MLVWPNVSWTTFGWTPRASAMDAYECGGREGGWAAARRCGAAVGTTCG
jgi:hypothetical protein